jgi:hypothetical protein
MISSEVQRTLVKSPPELWAELSNPEALARHLGELGEIRIVRVDPEKSVEWEAENTTGKVSISASGWGTRVTLEVTREHVPAEEPAAQAASAPAEAAEPLPEAAEPQPDAVEPLPEPVEPVSDAPEPLPHAPEPHLDPEPACEATGPVPEGVPHVPEPGGEPDLRSDGELEDLGYGEAEDEDPEAIVAVSPAVAATAAGERAAALAASEPEEPESVEPPKTGRRGFFARLFGRRSRTADVAGVRVSIAVEEPVTPSHEPDALEYEEEDTAPLPATGAELPPAAEDTEPVSVDGYEPGEDRVAVQAHTHTAVTLAVDPAPETSGDGDHGLEASGPAAGQPPALPDEEPPEIVADGEPPEAGADAGVPDLAAELRAAEEAMERQITDVLTGVLDRLGAAHHRPFSRA